MSLDAKVSLIDLTKQFPFSIDEELKKELCFGETLIISCGHYEGSPGPEDSTKSEWSCYDTEETEEAEEVKDEMFEVKDFIEEKEEPEPEPEEENDFHFYFFPDCNKRIASQSSQTSVLMVNGIPKINPALMTQKFCTCGANRRGECICVTKLPCKCGAKTKPECVCSKAENICVCDENKPNLVCKCGSKVCVCNSAELPKPYCTCDKIHKPCVCYSDRFPCPVCKCKKKSTFGYLDQALEAIGEGESEENTEEGRAEGEGEMESETVSSGMNEADESKYEPCICQKPDPKTPCLCLKGKKCECLENACICGVQKSCVCEPTESQSIIICLSEDSKSICSCPTPKECTCDVKSADCQCFPKPVCTCGSPDNCKCFLKCDCTIPCICDTLTKKPQECVCLDRHRKKNTAPVCTCPCRESDKQGPYKLKKVRATKHGYRWCHDVDPQHTFFDYAYGWHDRVDSTAQEEQKLKILGLHPEPSEEGVCEVHGPIAPPFEKKVRKPSLDCCSAVGGICINVETLGEEKDKFLVQVTSHASKEGAKTGTRLIAIVDSNLHTLEENRTEYITKKELTKERRSYMAICESAYYNKITRICGERHAVKRLYHTFEAAHNFLLEGANVILLRYFGLRRYKGTVKTDTVLMDGTICQSIYVCPGVSQAIVNNTPLYVVKVERHIMEPSGAIHQTLTVLTLRGYIVSHEWADNNYILHLNPLLRINPEKDEIEPHAPLRERWREDLQLFSDYLNFKSTRTSEGARYMTENGALMDTVRDYLQAILLLKPSDVLHFTRHYFSSALSALDLPHDDYFDPCPKHVRYYYFEE